jgi:hypothetical protein
MVALDIYSSAGFHYFPTTPGYAPKLETASAISLLTAIAYLTGSRWCHQYLLSLFP